MAESVDGAREDLLQRRAERFGLRLEKSRRPVRGAPGIGTYVLTKARQVYYRNTTEDEREVVAATTSEGHGMSLDDIDAWLDRREERQRAVDAPHSTYVAVSREAAAWNPSGIARSVLVDERVRLDYDENGELLGVLLLDVEHAVVKTFRRNWPGFDVPTEGTPR